MRMPLKLSKLYKNGTDEAFENEFMLLEEDSDL